MTPPHAPALQTGEVITPDDLRVARKTQRRLVGTLAAASTVILAISFFLNAWLEKNRVGLDVRSSYSFKGDGYRASQDVLEKLGYQAVRHRKSYGQLPPPERSVLMIVDPLEDAVLEEVKQTVVDASQIRELESWVRRGGRLIVAPPGRTSLQAFGYGVLATHSAKSPPGRLGKLLDGNIVRRLLEKMWPEFESGPPAGDVRGEGDLEGFVGSWRPLPENLNGLVAPFVRRAGARTITELPPFLAQIEEQGAGALEMDLLAGEPGKDWTPIARLGEKVVLASTSIGEGKIYFFCSAYPLTNIAFARAGTAPLVMAALDLATDGGQRVVAFDEYSHGLWARKGFLAWVVSTTLIYPVAAVLIGILLLLWQGAVRPGAAREERVVPRRAKEEFVMSLADILLRARRYGAARDSLIEAFEARHGAWAHRVARLKAEAARNAVFGPPELVRVAAALDDIKRQIAIEAGGNKPVTQKYAP